MAEHSADFDTLYDEMERGFFAILSQGDGPHLEQVIRSEQAALYESNRGLATDEQSTFHLRCMTLAIAAYRVLQVSLPKDDAFEKVRRAFIEPGRADALREMAEMLNTPPTPSAISSPTPSPRRNSFGGRRSTSSECRTTIRSTSCTSMSASTTAFSLRMAPLN